MADVSFLNGNPMSRVMESRHHKQLYASITLQTGLPFKNEISATVSKNKPQSFILQHIDKIRVKLLQELYYLCHNTSLTHAILKVFIILMLKSNVSGALLYTYCHSTSPLPIHLSFLIASDMRLLLYNI